MGVPIRHRLAALAVSAGVGLSGCGAGSSHIAVPRPDRRGLLPASPQLNDRIVLQRTNVKAGTPIRGELMVVNRGERPISLLTHGCHPASAVVLTNGRITAVPGFTTECLTRPLVISPGENRLAMSVATTYTTCSGTPAQATAAAPACPPGPQLPPLPAGRYRAFLVGIGLALPDPPPVTVILTDTRGD